MAKTAEKKETGNNKGYLIVGMLIVSVVCVAVSYFGYITHKVNQWEDTIYPGVVVRETSLEGLSKNEAETILNDKYKSALEEKEIVISVEEEQYTLTYLELEAQYDISKVVDEALQYGRDKSVLEQNKIIKNSEKYEIELDFSYDESVIESKVNEIAEDVKVEAKDAEFVVNGIGDFTVEKHKNGKSLNTEILIDEIQLSVNDDLNELTDFIEGEIITEEAKIKDDFYSFINNTPSYYSTSYSTSGEGRATNIQVSTRSLNGTLIMPGEVFSFNETVGPRTAERGYKSANVIVGDEFVEGLGGGICQTSTTLYNAVLLAGLDITERSNHSLAVSYVPLSLDAAVSWGWLDLKFKNTTEYPVYIEGYTTSNKEVVFRVYSDKPNNVTYKTYSEVLEVREPSIKQIEDNTMAVGEEYFVKKPQTGYVSVGYRDMYIDGKYAETEVLGQDIYDTVNGEKKVGTKSSSASSNPGNDNGSNDGGTSGDGSDDDGPSDDGSNGDD